MAKNTARPHKAGRKPKGKHKTAAEKDALVKQAMRLMTAKVGRLTTAECARKLGVPIAWVYYNVGSARACVQIAHVGYRGGLVPA